jgi:2-polyprenyl-6-hydroxyphenyl methylase / 3-demethylubiquinone-9 3-methyltransferase
MQRALLAQGPFVFTIAALASFPPHHSSIAMTINADPLEVQKFSDLAHRWWDPESEFKPLHQINPLRLDWIDKIARLNGKTVVDVGCGGGILAEGMTSRGGVVTGIDLSPKALSVARLHLFESGQQVAYREISAEALALEAPASFDIVTCMEMLEHVPDPASTVTACTQLVKPGGHVFLSTLNRNAKAYLFAVIGAEYIVKLLPRGTHDYAKFIKPSELSRYCRSTNLVIDELVGLTYNPLSKTYTLGDDTDVNYLVHARREI